MKTSYFGRMNSNEFKHRQAEAVSIARGSKYWRGRSYAPLFPTWEMIHMSDPVEYERVYRQKILARLDPMHVYCELVEMCGEDPILLCHESAAKIESGEQFCHRTIVAKWLEAELWAEYDMDIKIPELRSAKSDLKEILKRSESKKIQTDFEQMKW